MNRWRTPKIAILLVLILTLILSSQSFAFAAADEASQVRDLLNNYYVDPVSEQVLNASSIEDMLKALGDPYTTYFTANEYQDFINSIDQRFSGIGIHMDIVPQGVLVTSVIKSSPAEETGIQEGDIITVADGMSLAGKKAEEVLPILRGESGSKVQLSIMRGTQALSLTVTRRQIEVSTVEGKVLDGHIGYIILSSFGDTTADDFAKTVDNLVSQHVDSWIFDLRNNPGGYLDTALNLAGYFIGGNTAMQMKGQTGSTEYPAAVDHGWTINQPMIFLINEYSASASEILSGAVKDYHKAVFLGKTTFGKGVAQSMFALDGGGMLKMTTSRFYTPEGHKIQKVGISPDLAISNTDSLTAAEILLQSSRTNSLGAPSFKVQTAGNTFIVAASQVSQRKYWQSWSEILSSLPATGLTLLTADGESTVSNADLQYRWPLYYPSYEWIGSYANTSLDKRFTVHFSEPVNWDTITDSSIELINSVTGERAKLDFHTEGPKDLYIIPKDKLQPGTTYWLVIHPAILGQDGRPVSVLNGKPGSGAIITAVTAGNPILGKKDKMTIQSIITPHDYGEALLKHSDYGQALLNHK